METDASFEGVSLPDHKRATYADLEALPENVIGQIVDGELIALPRPANPHGFFVHKLSSRLSIKFEQGLGSIGGWQFMADPELHLGEDVLVPDFAGWQAASPPEPRQKYFTIAPDWICEVLSPSTAKLDRERKLPIYARAKVGHAWIVDPEARTLEVLRRQEPGWELVGTWSADARVRAEPFDAIELDLGQLWV